MLFSPSPHLLDHFCGLYSGFLVFTSYQIPSHLVYRDPSPAYSQHLLVLLDQEYYFAD